MPSPSGSGSGHPSGVVPGSFGHLSRGSGTQSWSGSLSGQPVGAGPASFGQPSRESSSPSPSLSGGGGQPSGAGPASLGHLSFSSTMPSLSASGGGGGGAERVSSVNASPRSASGWCAALPDSSNFCVT